MKKILYVLGQDIASISSGINLVRGEFTGNDIKFTSVYEKAFTIENNFLSRYECSKNMVSIAKDLDTKYCIDLIVNEDYLNSMSYIAFSLGEFNGILRAFLYEAQFSVLLNNPAKFRAFILNGRKAPKGNASKKLIVDLIKNEFGYESSRHYVKERSDCSDAFVHGVIGIYYCFFLMGVPMDLLSPNRKKVFVNPKTKKGLLENKNLLLNIDMLSLSLEEKINDRFVL